MKDVLDLFCGAGGLSKGLEQAGYNIVGGVDFKETFLETFKLNHNNVEAFNYNLQDTVLTDTIRLNPDLVVGSPPCKGFSDARGSRYADSDINSLVFDFIHWVSKIKPSFIIMENVTGIKTIDNGRFIEDIIKEYEEIGYSIKYSVLNSANYGVPQKRKRVIFLGADKSLNKEISFPKKTHSNEDSSLKDYITVEESISDLPEPNKNGIVKLNKPFNTYQKKLRKGAKRTYNHKAKYPKEEKMKIIRKLEPGQMYRSTRFGERYRPVWEVHKDNFTNLEINILKSIAKLRTKKKRTLGNKSVGFVPLEELSQRTKKDKKKIKEALESMVLRNWLREKTINGNKGYDLNTKSGVRPKYMRLTPKKPSNTIMTTSFKTRNKLHPYKNRGLSLREGARIQSFPDNFRFVGSFNKVATQIGNAVPPLLSKKIGESIKEEI